MNAVHDLHATAPRGPSVWTSIEHLVGIRYVEISSWKVVAGAAGVALVVYGVVLALRVIRRRRVRQSCRPTF